MEQLIAFVAARLGVEPEVIIALLPTLVFLFNLISRLIPDDATGTLGVLNKIFKVLGLYVSNRVSKGVSMAGVAKVVMEGDVPARDSHGQFSNVSSVVKEGK